MKIKQQKMIPILQSSLPPFETMLPRLQEIEANRCHTNFGKFFRQYEERMAEFFNLSADKISILCNGTFALVAGLLALNIPYGKYCLMPSWTFSATPAAALLAGLKPYFLDVDLESQALTPEMVKAFLNDGSINEDEIGAVMVVSPFGSPISVECWDRFTRETTIPVMIDAAASFDTVHSITSMRPGMTPMMISLHATKIMGIGEGGLLLSKNTDYIQRVKGISNFGFNTSRTSSFLGMNAKMSEYQAAIGLAVLESWQDIRAKRLRVTTDYLNLADKLGLTAWLSKKWLTSTCNLLIPGQAEHIRDHLNLNNIEARIWWSKGCHTHPAYQHLPHAQDLSATAYLSQTMLAVPFSIDTTDEQIDIIGQCIAECLIPQEHDASAFALEPCLAKA